MEGFDVGLLREYSERQARDAERIVMLCDALASQAKELDVMRKAAKLPAGPVVHEVQAAPAPR